ncbi:3'-5' exonuclease [Phormidium sp. FACHB-1136]|uniref:3'-5' exonuclease n=1 Tax=Phormidium sp. FACHB-1136 TaxID=2692848 RepID=UPI001683C8A0|nr:3'-5' exonuclease [Phormidium sp. FACHB-1136]MBD2424959.1 ATP-dependent helicase [Phormidium sp. FACHB-1136]
MTYEYARLMNQESQIAKFVEGGDIDFSEPFVKVLTLADAKGLEFPFIAIVGMHSDTFPGDLTEILEEEREVVLSQKKRMLYVGCSRATRALLVTKPTKNPSEFIDLLREPLWEQRRSY